jgi:hypothetical protein
VSSRGNDRDTSQHQATPRRCPATPRTTEHKKPRRLLLKPYEKASASDSDSDQEERHRNAQAEYDRYFNSCLFAALAADLNVPELQAENMHTVSETNKMGYIFHRTFGEWTLELRISKLFNVCRTARPTELSPKDSLQQTQLHIRVALRAAEGIKLWDINTEEICVRITSAPGVVDRFETHFKERDDGICLLTIGLHASSLLSYRVCVAPVVELPIDVRLRTNWAPFGKQLNSKVRVTYMWFFGGHIGSPRTFVRYKDREMEGAEMVDVRDEGVRTVKCGWRFGRGRRR